MPDAIDPFLLVFNANALSSGGRILMRCGMGALLMTLTMAVYDLSSQYPENLISGGSIIMKALPVVF